MTPAKIKEHEPTAVKRDMSEKISDPGHMTTSSQDAAEKARRSGMTKGTAGGTEQVVNTSKALLEQISSSQEKQTPILFYYLASSFFFNIYIILCLK
jgi:hypothetical protein